MIPEKNDEIFISLPFKEINDKVKTNRILRERFFSSFNFFKFQKDELTVASGHQPYIFHAGIWAKIIFLNFFKKYSKIFITHDSDVKKGIFLDIPIYEGEWKKLREYIYLNSENKAFEEYDNNKFDEGINRFYKRFWEIKNYIREDIKEKTQNFINFLKNYQNPVEGLINARKNFEQEKSYEELKVSEISKEENFLKFFLYFFYNTEKILEIYNKSLKEFREIKDIKKEGEPFPFLLKDEDFFEIPFWYLRNERKRLFKNKNYLYAENEKLCELKGNFEDDIERIKKFKIRPRAFTLSIYQRVFISDLFIHGYGGKLYDELGEEVFEKIFGIKMPECAFITGTFYIFPGNPESLSQELSSLYERKNFIIHHPEKFLKDDEIVKKKQFLIEEIKKSKDKKKISDEIKKINHKLREKVKDIINEIDEQIKNLENRLREQKIKYFREYPYFYIDFKRIKKAIENKI